MRAISLHDSGRAGQGVCRADQGGRAIQGIGVPFKAAVLARGCAAMNRHVHVTVVAWRGRGQQFCHSTVTRGVSSRQSGNIALVSISH